jgi:hypothetical protein
LINQQTYEERVKPALAAAGVKVFTREMKLCSDSEDAINLLGKIDAAIKHERK